MGASLQEIAAALHVSPSTVSRAISAPHLVSAKTRERILKYVDKIGYKPNISARNLRRQSSTTVGIILNDLDDSIIAHAANVMQNIAFQRGYFPVLLTTDESYDKEAEALDRMLMSNVCGMVIIPSSYSGELFGSIDIPIVELDRSSFLHRHNEFRMDDTAAMQIATDYLIQQGCKHIAVLLGNIDRVSSFRARYMALSMCNNSIRYSPFLLQATETQKIINDACYLTQAIMQCQAKSRLDLAMQEAIDHAPPEQEPSASPLITLEGLQERLLPNSADLRHCTRDRTIDGLLTTNQSLCTGMLRAFNANPEWAEQNIKLFTFDNPSYLQVLPYRIATLSQPLEHAASMAMNCLLDRIEGKIQDHAEVHLLRPELLAD